jgi:hypothetical protein
MSTIKNWEEEEVKFKRIQSIPHPETPKGWYPLIRKLLFTLDSILDIDESSIEVTQIKEKFGGLRFYYNIENIESEARFRVDGAIHMAEVMARDMCSVCGETKEKMKRTCNTCETLQKVHES